MFTFADLRRLNRACDFSSGHKTVLLTLASYMDENGSAFPSRLTLEADTGLGQRRLRDIVRDLVDAGFITVTDDAERTTYTLQKLPELGGTTVPKNGTTVPHEGEGGGSAVPKNGTAVPKNGTTVPHAPNNKGRTIEGPEGESAARATAEPFSEMLDPDRVDYRGSSQPLARLAWAERTAKATVAPDVDFVDEQGHTLRGEFTALLVTLAERSRSHQPPMLQADACIGRLREALHHGGPAYALDCVRYALAVGAPWPVLDTRPKRLNQAKKTETLSTAGAYDDAF